MRFSAPSSNSSSRKFLRPSIIDLIWLFISPFLALAIRGQEFISYSAFPESIPPTYEYALLTFFSSVPIFLFFRVSDGINYLFSARDVLSLSAATICSVAASIYTVFFLNRLDGIPRTVPVIYGLLLIVGLTTYRILARTYYERKRHPLEEKKLIPQPNVLRRILLVGVDHFSISTIRLTDSQNPRTTQIVAAISINPKHTGKSLAGVKVIGDLSSLGTTIAEYRVHGVEINEVWISDNIQLLSKDAEQFIFNECNKQTLVVKKISEALNLIPVEVLEFSSSNNPELDFTPTNRYLKYKRIIDILSSIIISLIIIPVYPFVYLLALWDVGPPALFWQQRAGWHGKTFLVYKLRTLHQPLTEDGELLSDKQRMSKIGAFMRTSRLDELPQILSVIVGDMSLIGPRPLLPRDEPKDNRMRLSVRPGVTGLAQINGNDLLTPDERNALDCFYISRASLVLDLQILIKTIEVVFYGTKRNEEAISQALAWFNQGVSNLPD